MLKQDVQACHGNICSGEVPIKHEDSREEPRAWCLVTSGMQASMILAEGSRDDKPTKHQLTGRTTCLNEGN
jgi:hypothetical protein